MQSGSESEDQWDELSDYGDEMDVTEAKDDSDAEEDEEIDTDAEEEDEEADSDSDIVENGLSD